MIATILWIHVRNNLLSSNSSRMSSNGARNNSSSRVICCDNRCFSCSAWESVSYLSTIRRPPGFTCRVFIFNSLAQEVLLAYFFATSGSIFPIRPSEALGGSQKSGMTHENVYRKIGVTAGGCHGMRETCRLYHCQNISG